MYNDSENQRLILLSLSLVFSRITLPARVATLSTFHTLLDDTKRSDSERHRALSLSVLYAVS